MRGEYAYKTIQMSPEFIYITQNWQTLYLGQDTGDYNLMATSGLFGYYVKKPSYLEVYPISSTSMSHNGISWSRSSGVKTATQIRDKIFSDPINKDFYKFGEKACPVTWETALHVHKLKVTEAFVAQLDTGKTIPFSKGETVYFMSRGEDKGK